MNDKELSAQLYKAVSDDPNTPVIEQHFNPLDPVAIEIVMHEADFAIEQYMERWSAYREKFADPKSWSDFVLAYQFKTRKDLKVMIGQAQQYIIDELHGNSDGSDSDNLHEGYDYE